MCFHPGNETVDCTRK